MPMKTQRLQLMVSQEFQAYLREEARHNGVSVGELVRQRCERRSDENEALLQQMTHELSQAVDEAHISLATGLQAAQAVLAELAAQRAILEQVS